jgi:hypothetical protein
MVVNQTVKHVQVDLDGQSTWVSVKSLRFAYIVKESSEFLCVEILGAFTAVLRYQLFEVPPIILLILLRHAGCFFGGRTGSLDKTNTLPVYLEPFLLRPLWP